MSEPTPLSAAPRADVDIDTSGLTCPLPILRAKKALAGMASGQILSVVATDRNSIADFQAFCRQTGNTLLFQQDNDQTIVHYLQRR